MAVLSYGGLRALLFAADRQVAVVGLADALVARAELLPSVAALIVRGQTDDYDVLRQPVASFDSDLSALQTSLPGIPEGLVLGAIESEVHQLNRTWAPIRATLDAGAAERSVADQVLAHAEALQRDTTAARDALLQRLAFLRQAVVSVGSVTFLVTLTVVALAARFGRRHVAQPAARIAEGSARLRRGEFGYQVPISGEGELASLARGFNDMSTEMARLAVVEAELRQSQKMEAIGHLAGGIAHDFANALTAIRGYADMLTEQLEETNPLWNDLHQIQAATNRAAALTDRLLMLGRRQAPHFTALDVNEVVLETVDMLRRVIGERIDVRVDPATELPPILADRTQVQQILINLAMNARAAMPAGGTLVVSTALERIDTPPAGALGDPSGPVVVITVRDTGVGMDARTKAKVFEPFFTTKAPGLGTGLGLATVHSSVAQLGGRVTIDSAPGEGSTFRVVLPTSGDDKVAPRRPPSLRSGIDVGRETILLVEDDPAVRTFATVLLTRHGYHVYAAGNGRQALEINARLDGRFDLVLTDVVMPDMDGPELVRYLRAERDQVRVLYMSGHASGDVRATGFGRGEDDLIKKPFAVRMFLHAVRDALSRDAA